uniref:Uncharacterized protein n=1 Tax=Timema poppense TaxID=170557 RepID=A0A7R9GT20_TIMPO|nr:unnamed protein product [Timema poppensis]
MCRLIKLTYSSATASLVLTGSSQLTADGLENLPDQIMYPCAEPNDPQKHVTSQIGLRFSTCYKIGKTKNHLVTLYVKYSRVQWYSTFFVRMPQIFTSNLYLQS